MPCEQHVRVWSDQRGAEKFFKLLCTGECKADQLPCAPDTITEYTGGRTLRVERCRCDGGTGEEDTGCHIVLCTVKGGDEDGKRFHRCDGECKEKAKEDCVPVPVGNPHDVLIPTKDGKYTGRLGSYLDHKCECKPKVKLK
jgi:hypothetical protein